MANSNTMAAAYSENLDLTYRIAVDRLAQEYWPECVSALSLTKQQSDWMTVQKINKKRLEDARDRALERFTLTHQEYKHLALGLHESVGTMAALEVQYKTLYARITDSYDTAIVQLTNL